MKHASLRSIALVGLEEYGQSGWQQGKVGLGAAQIAGQWGWPAPVDGLTFGRKSKVFCPEDLSGGFQSDWEMHQNRGEGERNEGCEEKN
jgi:hypothetical protein